MLYNKMTTGWPVCGRLAIFGRCWIFLGTVEVQDTLKTKENKHQIKLRDWDIYLLPK